MGFLFGNPPMIKYIQKKIPIILLSCVCGNGSAQVTESPNIIFIIADDLNDYIEGLGSNSEILTPSINRIKENGTLFLNAFASSPQCGPSRTSMLTGKDPKYTQVYKNDDDNYSCNFTQNFTAIKGNEEYFTLPGYLKDSLGYFTYNINKIFHCDKRKPEYDSLTIDPCAKGLSWNKYTYYTDTIIINPAGNVNDEGVSGYSWARLNDSLEKYMTDYIATESAIKFINDYNANINACGKPFFLALGLSKPHKNQYIPEKYFSEHYVEDFYATPFNYPYNNPSNARPANGFLMPPQPEEPFADYYALPSGGIGRLIAKGMDTNFLRWAQQLEPLPLIDATLTNEERIEILSWSKRANANMACIAAVKFMDAQVGRLMDALEANPEILNNSIIFFLGDHGYSLGEKKHWGKFALWETDIRTSLIVADMRNPVPQISNGMVSLLDIFPTILDILNEPHPNFANGSQYLDGLSFNSLLKKDHICSEKPVLTSVLLLDGGEGSCFPQYSVRSEKFHYIRYSTNGGSICDSVNSLREEELYEIGVNRETDPNEWNNLVANPDYQPVINYLSQWLPDGDLYMDQTYKIKLKFGAIECLLSKEDTIEFSFDIYNATGATIDPPSGYVYFWTNNLTNDTIFGTAPHFILNIVRDDIFFSTPRLIVFFHMLDTTNHLVGFNTQYIYLNPFNTPKTFFNTVVSANKTVYITELSSSGTYKDIWWDFGDGTVVYSKDPGSHKYESEGIYSISCFTKYGNNEDCLTLFQNAISVEQSETGNIEIFSLFPNPANATLNILFEQTVPNGDIKFMI